MKKLFYSVQEISNLLNISSSEVYNILDDDEIKSYRISSRRVVSKEDYNLYLYGKSDFILSEEIMQKDLYGIKDLAIMLNVSETTIRKMYREDEISKPFYIGRKIMFKSVDLLKWLEEQQQDQTCKNGKDENEYYDIVI